MTVESQSYSVSADSSPGPPVVVLYSVNKAFLMAQLTAAPQLCVIHQKRMD